MLVVCINLAITVPVLVADIADLGSGLNEFAVFVLVIGNLFCRTEQTVCFNQVEIGHGMSFGKHIDTTTTGTVCAITGNHQILAAQCDFRYFILVGSDIGTYIISELIFDRTPIIHGKFKSLISYLSCILDRVSADTGRCGRGNRQQYVIGVFHISIGSES